MAPTLNPFSLAKFRIIPRLSLVVLVASKTFKSKRSQLAPQGPGFPESPFSEKGLQRIFGVSTAAKPQSTSGAHRNLPGLLRQVQLHIPQGSHGTLPAKEGTDLWPWCPLGVVVTLKSPILYRFSFEPSESSLSRQGKLRTQH